MRAALYSTVAILIAVSPIEVKAAEISEAGAREIVEKLTYYLPKSVTDTGFLKVTPGTKRYEMSVDFSPFLKNLDPQKFAINGLKPFVQYLTPQEDGLWKIEANDNFSVSGFFTTEGKRTDFTYAVEKMVFDGMFDPSLSFMRTASANVEKLKVSSADGPVKIDIAVDSYSTDMRAENIDGGFADIVSNVSGNGFTETITGDPTTGPLTISASSMDARVQMDKLGIVPVRDLVVFALDKVKDGSTSLTADEDKKLKGLIKANVPFVDNLIEDIHFRDVKIAAKGIEIALADFGYKIDFNGIKPDSRFGIELSVADPKVPAGLLPPGTDAALPKSASMGVAVTGLNVEGVLSYLTENADFTKPQPLTPEQSQEIGKIVLPDGKLHIAFSNVAAKSDIYDVSLSGTMLVNPDNSDKPEVDVTITARDLDKTVNFLQANANTVPQFGQASFMVLMMKGFGKEEADGSMTWNVKIDQAGKVTVNGREMPTK